MSSLLSFAVPFAQQDVPDVGGMVVDASGAPVPGAEIVIEIDGVARGQIRTADTGRFTVSQVPPGRVVIVVSAPGFASVRYPIAEDRAPATVVLHPAGLQESVSVTATRGIGALVSPASTSTVSSAELATSAAGPVDDILRNTPGFGLTRRSSSRVANPATQGVTMRGLPGNAGSRTLVLADGLPLNDLFGGWVYWNRIPEAAIERIEVVRGAAGDLYGGDAVSGVVQVFTFQPTRSQTRASFDVGSAQTSRGSIFASHVMGRWQGALAGEWVTTDGVPIVAKAERGAVDVNAMSRYRTGFATGGYAGDRWRARARVAAYVERRGNGTPLIGNHTNWLQFSGDVSAQVAGGTISALAAAGRQRYYNNFSSVPPSRASERLTSEQWLPSTFQSAAVQWSRLVGGHMLLLGSEHKRTEADVQEYKFAVGGARSGPFLSGGVENVSSLYGRAAIAAGSRVSVVAGARADFWKSTPREAGWPAHAINFFSPRLSVNWQIRPAIAVRGSAARAYRTPTLDELHRSSQVGNTVTLGNPLLDPEVLSGFEAGALLTGRRSSARVTGFLNRLSDAVTNVTVASTPSLITRQKKNSDTVCAHGIELEAEYRASRELLLTGSFVVTSSRYRGAVSLPALEGHRLPQIPTYQLGGTVTYANPRVMTLSLQVRAAGMQYEDDLNTLELAPFRVADVAATRTIGRGMQVYGAIENLFDAEIQTGRTPVTRIGWPRTVRGGIRVVIP